MLLGVTIIGRDNKKIKKLFPDMVYYINKIGLNLKNSLQGVYKKYKVKNIYVFWDLISDYCE